MLTTKFRSQVLPLAGIAFGALIFFFGLYLLWNAYVTNTSPTIKSFQECVEVGNAVAESNPRQCISEDGRSFIEDIDRGDDDSSSNDDMRSIYDVLTRTGATTLRIQSYRPGMYIDSPHVLQGYAPQQWFHSDTFRVAVLDWNGVKLGEAMARTTGAAGADDYRPFAARLEFVYDDRFSNSGTIVLQKGFNPPQQPTDSAELIIRFRKK